MAYNRDRAPKEDNGPEMIEKVVYLNRVSKTVKGGRVMKFSALVVVGDGKGTVGYGLGKAAEVSEAILKGIADAKKNMVKITLEGTTIPHDIIGEFGAGRVMLKPAPEGTGIIAGGAVRAVMEAVGISNIRAKCLRSNNPQNVVKATMQGLLSLRGPEEVARIRGKSVEDAEAILMYTPKAASEPTLKVLRSAIANAVNNLDMDKETLYVAECFANQGPTLRRYRPRSHGSASRIRKRTSHITIILDEKK